MTRTAPLRKGAIVTYQVRQTLIQAIVRTRHRDGTVTIEARHVLRDGAPCGCYLGYRYRMARTDIRAA